MEGRGEVDRSEWGLNAASGVAGFEVSDPLFAKIGRDLMSGENGGFAPQSDIGCIRHVVLVAMAHQDVGALNGFGGRGARRIVVVKRVQQQAMSSIIKEERGMSVVGDLQGHVRSGVED